MADEMIEVEVAYARPERQVIFRTKGPAGMVIRDAIQRCGVLKEFPEIDLEKAQVGVFSKAAKLDTALEAGDRVEIYRPLIADPKTARKKKAEKEEA